MKSKKGSEVKCPTCGESLIQKSDTQFNKLCSCWESKIKPEGKKKISISTGIPQKPEWDVTQPKWAIRPKENHKLIERATESISRLPSTPTEPIEEKLQEIGLDETEIEIFFQYRLNGLSFEEIKPLVGFRNQQQVNRKFQKALSKVEKSELRDWLRKRVKNESDA